MRPAGARRDRGSGRLPVRGAAISCLRFASSSMRVGCDFVVGATAVVNGNGLIESLMDDTRVFDPLDALDVLEVGAEG